MPEYSLHRKSYDPVTKACFDDQDQLISHVLFRTESEAWSALLRLMSKGMDGAGWYVRAHEVSGLQEVEHEAA